MEDSFFKEWTSLKYFNKMYKFTPDSAVALSNANRHSIKEGTL